MTDAPDLHAQLDIVLRQDRGRLLAALIATLGDFELAEDALSDALESALIHWGRSGVPDNPQGWLLKVARRKAIDRIRRAKRFRERVPDITLLAEMDELQANEPRLDIADERLRLIFTCCHPALEPKSQVALTLRTLGGLTTAQIAAAFLDQDATMGQRLTRARKKIAAAGIPFAYPGPDQWGARLNCVLAVLYLIFNAGYSGNPKARVNLCDEAIFLVRLLDQLTPEQPEVEGLLALLLITHARAKAREDASGAMVSLSDQDRGLWDFDMIKQGCNLLEQAMARNASGPYQIKAAISALHSQSQAQTDWRQIVLLYDALFRFEPTPIVALNRATALAETGAVAQGLADLEQISDALQNYQPFHAAHAEYLARNGQCDMARVAYDRAIVLTANQAEQNFLQQRKEEL